MGYDLLQRNVDCLKQGSIFFLIAQQPTLQGLSLIHISYALSYIELPFQNNR